MQNVTLSTVETALCKGLQQILLEYDDGSPLSNAVLQRLELRCIEHIHVAFSLAWASMDRDLSALRTGRLGRNYKETSDPRIISTIDQAVPSGTLLRHQPPALQNRNSNTHNPTVTPGSASDTAGPQVRDAPTHSREEESFIDSSNNNINNSDSSIGSSSGSKGGEDMDLDLGFANTGRTEKNERNAANTTSSGSTHRERAPRKNISYRKGLYADVVGLRGPLPTCQTCREKVARGQKRFILHRTIGHNHGIITFYHFNKTCIDGAKLSTTEQATAYADLALKRVSARDPTSGCMSPIKTE